MVFLLSLPMAVAAQTFYELSGDVSYDDNVPRAEVENDIEDDFIFSIRGGAGRVFAVNDISGLILRAQLEGNFFEEFDDLHHLRAKGSAVYRIQPSPAYTAPWYELNLSLSQLEFRDSDIRNGSVVTVGANVGKRFTDRIEALAGYKFENRWAREDDVFDIHHHDFFATLDYSLTESLTFYTGYSFRTGEVVSTAVPTTKIINGANEISRQPDNVFGPGTALEAAGPAPLPGPGPAPGPGLPPGPAPAPLGPMVVSTDRFAYQLDADTHLVDLGANYAINRSTAIDVVGHYYETNGKLDNDYDGFIVSASLLLRFK